MRAIVDGDRRPNRPAPRHAASTRARSVPAATRRAAGMAPARFEPAEDRRRARTSCRSRALSVRMTPAAARAGSSPLLWPATASGCRPSRDSTWNMAHWDDEHGGDRGVGRPERLRRDPRRSRRDAGSAVPPRPTRARSDPRCRAPREARESAGKGRRASPDTASPRRGRGTPGNPSPRERLIPEVNAAGVADRLAWCGSQPRLDGCETLGQFLQRARHEPQPCLALRPVIPGVQRDRRGP